MADVPLFRSDLYRGTAIYYDRFRPPYPEALLDDLRARAPIGGGRRLLDLACGTGQIALALATDFAEVVAIDQEAESVAVGQARAQKSAVTNVEWHVGRAEEVAVDGPFDLVGIGNAFHRLDRDVVASRAKSWLVPGGCVALLWGGTPWREAGPWGQVMADTLDEWTHRVGATDRIPTGWEEALTRDPNPRVLERAGLTFVGAFDFAIEHVWSVETLTGLVYSTSFLNRVALGDHVDEFEQDLARRLLACEPAGVFRQQLSFGYELARRPD